MLERTGGGRARTLAEWADELGCHIETLRRAARQGELLAYRHPLRNGRPMMALPEDVKSFLEKRRLNGV